MQKGKWIVPSLVLCFNVWLPLSPWLCVFDSHSCPISHHGCSSAVAIAISNCDSFCISAWFEEALSYLGYVPVLNCWGQECLYIGSGTSGVDGRSFKAEGRYWFFLFFFSVLQHTVSAYVAQVCRGFDLQLHVCLFSVMEAVDSSGVIPARYANPAETAVAFKEIVRAGNGRFHWFGEAGMWKGKSAHISLSLIK